MQSKLTKTIEDKIAKLKRYGAEPDRELVLWENWIKVRKEEFSELAKRTTRPPADLVLNVALCKAFREDRERKILLENAKILKKVGPRHSLWERPARLYQRCYGEPEYEAKRTRGELGKPRIIEHVGVPEYIQVEEEGMRGKPTRNACPLLAADYVRYRAKREEELKEEIQKMNPVRPDMKELVVIGRKPKRPPTPIPPLPQLIFTDSTNTCFGPLKEVYAIRINNTVIFKETPDISQPLTHLRKLQQESWHEHCYTWTYYFNVPLKKIGRAKLHLENLGTVTLRYCWKKIRRIIPFIPEDIYEQTFFFYKSEDVIPPGQSKEIFFTFVSEKPGRFSESWEFSLSNICLFNSLADKFVVNLNGDSVENVKGISKRIDKLERRIEKKAIQRLVLGLINDIVSTASIPVQQIYPYKRMILESEMFVLKNPVCFYHQTEVLNLREKYEKEMVPGNEWDLSIATWRQAMINKEFEDRMVCYDFLKKSHASLLKPWYEGDDLLLEKYRAVKMILGQLADKFFDTRHQLLVWNGVIKPVHDNNEAGDRDRIEIKCPLIPDKLTGHTMRNAFYMHMYEHVTWAMETCAGVLSSLELNKMLQFDFCRF